MFSYLSSLILKLFSVYRYFFDSDQALVLLCCVSANYRVINCAASKNGCILLHFAPQ